MRDLYENRIRSRAAPVQPKGMKEVTYTVQHVGLDEADLRAQLDEQTSLMVQRMAALQDEMTRRMEAIVSAIPEQVEIPEMPTLDVGEVQTAVEQAIEQRVTGYDVTITRDAEGRITGAEATPK